MKKLLILVLVVIGGASYFKGNPNLAQDSHVRSAGWSLPTLGVGQGSDLLAMVSTMLMGHGQTPQAAGAQGGMNSQYGANQPPRQASARAPALPNVTSATGTQNTSGTGGASGAGLAKGGDLTIPPELMRFMNPSLLTTTPAGTQNLSPAARLALQQIIAQARANPAAFKEQFGGVAKTLRGSE